MPGSAAKPPAEPDDREVIQCATLADWEGWLEDHHADVGRRLAEDRQEGSGATHGPLSGGARRGDLLRLDRRPAAGATTRRFFLQRFTPRGPRSMWSQVNRDKATALIEAGRMREAGLAQVGAAQDDGRWDAAYEPQSRATVPPDFQQALDENPAAREFFATLTGSAALRVPVPPAQRQDARRARTTDRSVHRDPKRGPHAHLRPLEFDLCDMRQGSNQAPRHRRPRTAARPRHRRRTPHQRTSAPRTSARRASP